MVNRTIRFEFDALEQAELLQIDVNEVCRNALDLEIKFRNAEIKLQKSKTHEVSRMNILTALKDGLIDADQAMKRLNDLDE